MLKKFFLSFLISFLFISSTPIVANDLLPIPTASNLVDNLPISDEGRQFFNIYMRMIKLFSNITGTALPAFLR